MSKNTNVAPFNNLEEIANRKQQLRQKIKAQEEVLSTDFDDYQEDVDAFKNLWSGILGFRRFRQNGIVSGISKLTSGGSATSVALTVATKVIKFLWNRRKR